VLRALGEARGLPADAEVGVFVRGEMSVDIVDEEDGCGTSEVAGRHVVHAIADL
jgi:hypothetical protein